MNDHGAKATDWVRQTLAALDADDLRRQLVPLAAHGAAPTEAETGVRLNLASNDYLGLAADPRLAAAAARASDQEGVGATASRLVTGTRPSHEALEQELATWFGYDRALVFGSGYLANLGVLDALCDRRSAVFADRLNHASLIDGVRLAGARLHRYRHNDPADLDRLLRRHPTGDGRQPVIVTDSVFSMDGDCAPLADLAAVASEHGAVLIVDEAHAIGVLGPAGAGLAAQCGVQPDVITGGFGKAFGVYGGFAAAHSDLAEFLLNKARTFIYSTALPPPVVAALHTALRIIRTDDSAMGERLLARATRFRDALASRGFDVPPVESPILPIVVGDNGVALAMARQLAADGIRCSAIRPPTVPRGTARLRATVTLDHSVEALLAAADSFAGAGRSAGLTLAQ